MRVLVACVIAITCWVSSANAQTDTRENIDRAFHEMYDILWDCLKKEAMHAIESGGNSEAVAQTMMTLCERQIKAAHLIFYRVALSHGRSDEQALEFSKHAIAESLTSILKGFDENIPEQSRRH
jgi:predicted PolB exonuclease-like 3'-5' exonuclease